MRTRWTLLLPLLGGCYFSVGGGYARNSGDAFSLHATAGVNMHFGERSAMHVGAGGSMAAAPAKGTWRYAGPLLVGGQRDVIASDADALALALDAQLPLGGWASTDGMTTSVGTGRGYLGVGYRHGWHASPKHFAGTAERLAGTIALTAGPEMFYASDPDVHATFGVAADLTLTAAGWVFRDLFETPKNAP
jgi:hypothetical protein